MSTRNLVAVGLTAVSMFLIVPGLVLPMLTITASIDVFGTIREIFRETQSILQAARRLHESGNSFVAGLILFFSVTVPFLKMLAFLVVLGIRRPGPRYRLYLAVRSLSKWAMADVFVVGVFIAFLAARAMDSLDAEPGAGLYWFTAYCLVSNLAFQFLHVPAPVAARAEAPPPPPAPA